MRNERGAALIEGAAFLLILVPVCLLLVLVELLIVSFGVHCLQQMKADHAVNSGLHWAAECSEWLGMRRQNFDASALAKTAIRKSLKEMGLPSNATIVVVEKQVQTGGHLNKTVLSAEVTLDNLPMLEWTSNWVPTMGTVNAKGAVVLPNNQTPPAMVQITAQIPTPRTIVVPCYGYVSGGGVMGAGSPAAHLPLDYTYPGYYHYHVQAGEGCTVGGAGTMPAGR